jgi:hypothetical protein
MRPLPSEMRTVTLSAREIHLVHGLVERACLSATPQNMRYLIELERVAGALDDALEAGRAAREAT